MVLVKPVVDGICINPEGERVTVNQRLVVLMPVGDGVKRLAHDADLKGMVVIRSPRPQLVPFSCIDLGNHEAVRCLGSWGDFRKDRCLSDISSVTSNKLRRIWIKMPKTQLFAVAYSN